MECEFYPDGTLVLSINGETDSDEEGQERNTGPRAWGYVADYSPECGYSVYFTNGTTIYLEHEQMEDRKAYEVATPEVMASRMQAWRDMDNAMQSAGRAPRAEHYETISQLFKVAT